MRIVSHGHTDVGRRRKHNEDAFFADDAFRLYIVCDGMGGHAAGEVASRVCIDTVRGRVQSAGDALEALERGAPEAMEAALRSAVEAANAAVFAIGESDPDKKGLGTTCSALVVRGGKAVLAHVGDTRIYLLRGGAAHQLTEDHTFLQEALRAGVMTPEQARTSTHRNIVTRAVGPLAKVKVDTLVFDLLEGDQLLLCSDGLHGYIEGLDAVPRMLDGDPAQVARKLVEFANQSGGEDNITALLVRSIDDPTQIERATLVNACLDTFRHIHLFAELTMPELLRVTSHCRTEHYKAGQVIVREDEVGDSLYLLVTGQVSVERGRSVVALLGPGAHFGEMALLSQRPRSASVVVRTDSTVMALERDSFVALLQQDALIASRFLWRLAQSLSLRLDDLYQMQEAEKARGSSGSTLRFGLIPSPFQRIGPR